MIITDETYVELTGITKEQILKNLADGMNVIQAMNRELPPDIVYELYESLRPQYEKENFGGVYVRLQDR